MNTTPTIASPTILVVDDDTSIATLLREFLGGEGYRVLLARNGREALASLQRERPALVLCDWMMPAMDGPHLIHAMHRAHGAIAAIPIVLMSSAHTAREAMPNVHFLAKPFVLDELLELVSSLTRPESTVAMLDSETAPNQEGSYR
jgi:CheY-like chemotaxis protein